MIRAFTVLLVLATGTGTSGFAQFELTVDGDRWARHQRAQDQYAQNRIRASTEAVRQAMAHERMPFVPYRVPESNVCPVLGGSSPDHFRRGGRSRKLAYPTARLMEAIPAPRKTGSDPANEHGAQLFKELISSPIIQRRCVACHVVGGLSGHTRLVFHPTSVPDHVERNFRVLSEFVSGEDGAADLVLAKIQGIGHGGGIQVPAGSSDFLNMERFMRALEAGAAAGGSLTPDRLFNGVTMAPPATVLRRAALLYAGRLPTASELAEVRSGGTEALRRSIRALMTGPGFHDFLIRASNDRLLTDRHIDRHRVGGGVLRPELTREFVDLARKHVELLQAAKAKGYQYPRDDPQFQRWMSALDYALARTPLELIAHVVENDLPYTEILTAPYIMANSVTAEIYGASTEFENPLDPTEFRPSRIVSYYRTDDSKKEFLDHQLGRVIEDPGKLATIFPHAGILSTNSFLRRYPTTDTSRNRARSRWTYYFFLDVDISRAAARTTDPVALLDRDNPTLKNPACTVCHRIMDPVAGTFQNYGNHGLYKDQFGGLDSLPLSYKYEDDTLYRPGDRWYRDMLAPGFGNLTAPDPDTSLQWLAEQIVGDGRFAVATVKFWWRAIMGAEITRPPEDPEDPDAAAQLLAATAQQAEVERIAAVFREGTEGGRPYNGKDLLVEIVLSPWFRAERLSLNNPLQARALRDAGARRLLTPEELARKTEMVSGYVWGRRLWRMIDDDSPPVGYGFLEDFTDVSTYRLLYGGIDSAGITERVGEMTAVMMAVARTHAAEVACPIVRREFFYWPPDRRLLFEGVDRFTTPESEQGSTAIRRKIVDLHSRLLGIEVAIDSVDVEDTYALFVDLWSQNRSSRPSFLCLQAPGLDDRYWDGLLDRSVEYYETGHSYRFDWERIAAFEQGVDTTDPTGTVRAWVGVLAYLLTDHRYLYL